MLTSPSLKIQTKILGGILLVFVLLFSISLLSFPFVLNLIGLSQTNGTILFISRLLYWLCLLLIYLYAIKIEKQNLLIWEEKKYKFWVYLIMVLAIFLTVIVGVVLIGKILSHQGLNNHSEKMAGLITIFHDNGILLVFTALTAGVVEELIFRGYLLPRLTILFKSPLLGIAVSSLLFGLIHYRYGTIFNVIGPVFIGLVFSFYYWKYRNIKMIIFCHFLYDLIVLFAQVHAHK